MPLMTLPLRLLAAACAATLLLSDPARCVVARGGAQQQQVLQEHLLSQNQVADDNVEYPPDCAQRLNESSLALTSPTLLCVPQSDLPRAGEINCTQWYSQKMPDGVTFYKTPTSVIRTFLYAQRCDAGDAGEFACVQDFDNATLTSASSDCANSLNNVNLRDGAVKTEINYKTELRYEPRNYIRVYESLTAEKMVFTTGGVQESVLEGATPAQFSSSILDDTLSPTSSPSPSASAHLLPSLSILAVALLLLGV